MSFLTRWKPENYCTKYVPQLTALKAESKIDYGKLKRHPDPETCHNAIVSYPDLQVRGVWKKLRPKEGQGVNIPAYAYTSFTYKGQQGFLLSELFDRIC